MQATGSHTLCRRRPDPVHFVQMLKIFIGKDVRVTRVSRPFAPLAMNSIRHFNYRNDSVNTRGKCYHSLRLSLPVLDVVNLPQQIAQHQAECSIFRFDPSLVLFLPFHFGPVNGKWQTMNFRSICF